MESIFGAGFWSVCFAQTLPLDLGLTDFKATYEETSTTALSASPAVAVPLLTINGWILMQRRVLLGSVSFNQNWAEYRDGFESAAGNENYWLGLDKVYRLVRMGGVRLRVEVLKTTSFVVTQWRRAERRGGQPRAAIRRGGKIGMITAKIWVKTTKIGL